MAIKKKKKEDVILKSFISKVEAAMKLNYPGGMFPGSMSATSGNCNCGTCNCVANCNDAGANKVADVSAVKAA